MSIKEDYLNAIVKRLKDELYFYEHQTGLIKEDKIRELNYLLYAATGGIKGVYDKTEEDKYQ
jgi:hypothetical protein